MSQWDDEFIRLVDNFVVETKDPRVLEEIAELDRESQLLGISFYDMYCVVLQDVKGHQTLVAEFKTYMSERFSRAGDLLCRTAQMRLGSKALKQEFRIARNHHQKIVEVVRDPAGKAADRFHLLRLAKLLLQRAPFGNVFGEKLEYDVIILAPGRRLSVRQILEPRYCCLFSSIPPSSL